MKNLLKVQVQASDILEYMKDGEDCKIEIDSQGDAYVLPLEASGFKDTVLVQVIEAYHYKELESDTDFISWLKDAYEDVELTGLDEQLINIKIK